MWKFIVIFFILANANASISIYGQNSFDPERSEKVDHIHAVAILCSYNSNQEPIYRFPKLIEPTKSEIILEKIKLPEKITFFSEVYFKNSPEHILIERVLKIRKVDDVWSFYLYKKTYNQKEARYELEQINTWIRSKPPTLFNMHLTNCKENPEGFDILIDDGILVEL